MPRLTRPTARRAAAALAAASTVALSAGCAVSPAVNQFSTELQYAPSDGVQGYFALSETDAEGPGTSLYVRNVLLIGTDADSPARLLGVIINDDDEEVSVSVSGPGGLSAEVPVPGRSSVSLSGAAEDSTLLTPVDAVLGELLADPVGAVPGQVVPVEMAAEVDGERQVLSLGVPLHTDSLPEYATLAPTAPATAGTTS